MHELEPNYSVNPWHDRTQFPQRMQSHATTPPPSKKQPGMSDAYVYQRAELDRKKAEREKQRQMEQGGDTSNQQGDAGLGDNKKPKVPGARTPTAQF